MTDCTSPEGHLYSIRGTIWRGVYISCARPACGAILPEEAEAIINAHASLTEKVKELREALLRVEYVTEFEPQDNDEGVEICPWCQGISWHGGHEERCARQKALGL